MRGVGNVSELGESGHSAVRPSMATVVQVFATVICSLAVGLLIVSTWRLLP
jgi:hypothetical protein